MTRSGPQNATSPGIGMPGVTKRLYLGVARNSHFFFSDPASLRSVSSHQAISARLLSSP
jgi:hypothetical protein